MERLVELMREKGVKRFVHFHTDHWEPFSSWDRWGDEASENTELILKFIEETSENPYFDKMTLFYNHPVKTISLDEMDGGTDDLLVFEPQNPPFWERYQYAIRKCANETKHEFQVHIHHEGITSGEYFKFQNLNWPDGFEKTSIESRRFERYLEETLLDFWRITGLKMRRWSFIHGVWALNASDTDVCNINDEIEILMRNGCIADFSMPAGRGWVDSSTMEPHTVVVNNVPKGYDKPEAMVRKIGEKIPNMERRFLIWNQEIPYTHCSIDHYGSDLISNAIINWEDTLSIWIEKSPIIGDTAFVKTHAHTMNREYWKEGAFRTYNLPELMRLFQKLEEVCEQSSVRFEKWTVEEVISHIFRNDPKLNQVFERDPMLDIESLDKKIVGIGKERMTSMGQLDGGMYDYYQSKLDMGSVFDRDDEVIIRYILENYDREARILEFAAGIGQVTLALGSVGFRSVSIAEFDQRRVDFAEEVRKNLDSGVGIISGDYRDLELDRYDLIFATNAVSSSLGINDFEKLSKTIFSGTDVILQFGYYGNDNAIFEKLENDPRITFETMATPSSNKNNSRKGSFVRYSFSEGV